LSLYNDVDTAVKCFRPLLKKLAIKKDFKDKRIIYLMEVLKQNDIPELKSLGLENWSITLIKEKPKDAKAYGRLVTRYRKEQDFFQYIIYLNEDLFFNSKAARKKRKIVFTHEFTHFAAHVYAFSTDKVKYIDNLGKKFENTMGEIFDPEVSELFHLLENKEMKDVDSYYTFKDSQHTHFYMNIEKIDISYTELYYNLLFSKEDFEEYFNPENKEKFYQLCKDGKHEAAMDLYHDLVKKAAETEWIPEQFAINQADNWIINYIKKNPLT
jgi:hypothetical protein